MKPNTLYTLRLVSNCVIKIIRRVGNLDIVAYIDCPFAEL